MRIISTHYWGNWETKVLLIPEKEPKAGEKIRAWALGSLYRMNAKTADCYAFNLKGRTWEGGWDWTNHLTDEKASHLLMLTTGQFYKIFKQ